MKNKKFRIYNIILSDIKSKEDDANFGNYVNSNKFDYWRYFAHNWIILTPVKVSSNDILKKLMECYGDVFFAVFEITVNDVAGKMPSLDTPDGKNINPFDWFYKMEEADFVPRWEREK